MTQPSIEDVQQEIIDEFAFFDDWTERYQHIIDLGRKLTPFPEAFQTDAYRVRGCQSRVWLKTELGDDGRLHIDAVSDAAIVSGLIALLLRVYNDRPPAEIAGADPHFIADIGLSEHLSPTRKTGLSAMVAAIRANARDAAEAA